MEPVNKTDEDKKYDELVREIASVCNRYSVENRSNTPDFLLAEFMLGCLNVYENTVNARADWHTRGTAETA